MRLTLILVCAVVIAGVAFAGADLSEEKVKALLNEWVEAQNSGSFSRYERLYGKNFSGKGESLERCGSWNLPKQGRG